MNKLATPLQRAVLASPVGNLHAFATEDYLCGLLWPDSDDSRFDFETKPTAPQSHPIFEKLSVQLTEYFSGNLRAFDLPLLAAGTEFQQQAWTALQKIPFGQTRSYAQQAEIVGRPKAIRAIGSANARNPISIVIPCHRVIGKNGSLTGFAGGTDAKKFLLDHEASILRAAS